MKKDFSMCSSHVFLLQCAKSGSSTLSDDAYVIMTGTIVWTHKMISKLSEEFTSGFEDYNFILLLLIQS